MTRKMIYIEPIEGVSVRVPFTKALLPTVGAWVPTTNYWLRRKNDGSVREVSPPIEPTIAPSKYKTNKEVSKNVN